MVRTGEYHHCLRATPKKSHGSSTHRAIPKMEHRHKTSRGERMQTTDTQHSLLSLASVVAWSSDTPGSGFKGFLAEMAERWQ